MAATEVVLEKVNRRMNDLEHRQLVLERKVDGQPQSITIGPKLQGSVTRGDFYGSEVMSNQGKAHRTVVSLGKDNRVREEQESGGRQPEHKLPLRKRHKHKTAGAKKAETVILLPPSPVRPRPKEKAVKHTAKGSEMVAFTLTFDILGTDVIIPVTLDMSIRDTISAAVARSVLKGLDATHFAIANPDGRVWDSEAWQDACNEAAYGSVDSWPAKLVVKKEY